MMIDMGILHCWKEAGGHLPRLSKRAFGGKIWITGCFKNKMISTWSHHVIVLLFLLQEVYPGICNLIKWIEANDAFCKKDEVWDIQLLQSRC